MEQDWIERLKKAVCQSDHRALNDTLEADIPSDIPKNLAKTPLSLAVSKNDTDTVKYLCENKKYRQFFEEPDNHIILGAAKSDTCRTETFLELLKAGFRTSVSDTIGRQPIHILAEENSIAKLEALVNKDPQSLKALDHSGNNALHSLFGGTPCGDIDNLKLGVSLLVRHGVDTNHCNKQKKVPVFLVFDHYFEMNHDIVRYLLQVAKEFDATVADESGETLLHFFTSSIDETLERESGCKSAIDGNEKLILDLLNDDLLIHSPFKQMLNFKNKSGYTPFCSYIQNKHFSEDTMKLMIQFGASVNSSSNLGITPLMEAALRGNNCVVEILLQAGADPNFLDVFGQSVLFRTRSTETLELLLSNGIDIFINDRFGRSPLMEFNLYTPETFPRYGFTFSQILTDTASTDPIAKILIKRGLTVNSQDRHGSTPLHYAAWSGDHQGMLPFLLEHGASTSSEDKYGFNPFKLAKYHGHNDVCSVLRNWSTEMDTGENSDNTLSQVQMNKYSRIIISEEDTYDMETSLSTFDLRCNTETLIESLLQSPLKGISDKKEENLLIKRIIKEWVSLIANRVSELDARFKCTVFATGSAAEGTKIGDPIEFDFVFNLDLFSTLCTIVQPNCLYETGFALLRVDSRGQDYLQLAPYVRNDGYVSVDQVRKRFIDLITEAVNEADSWQSEYLYFDGLLSIPNEKPILNVQMHWFGPLMKHLVLGIDIVPAIYTTDWVPSEIDKQPEISLTGLTIPRQYFLLFHPPERFTDGSDFFVRISSAPMEIDILQSFPDKLRYAYCAGKILKDKLFCPSVLFDDDNNVSDEDSLPDTLVTNSENTSEMTYHFLVPKDKQEKGDYSSLKAKCELTNDVVLLNEKSSNDDLDKTVAVKLMKKDYDPVAWIIKLDDDLNKSVKKLYIPKEARDADTANHKEQCGDGCANIDSAYSTSSTNLPSNEGASTIDQKKYTKQCEEEPSEKVKDKSKNVNSSIPIQKVSRDGRSASTACDHTHQVDGESTDEPTQADENSSEQYNKSVEIIYERGTPVVSQGKGRTLKGEGEQSVVLDAFKYGTIDVSLDGKRDNCDAAAIHEVNEAMSEYSEMEWEGGDVAQAADEISSYMLKNSLFYVCEKGTQAIEDMKISEVTIKMYEYLADCAERKYLPAYFLPFINIFSYVDTHIRKLPIDEVEVLLEQKCHRISVFCKVILGILKHLPTDKTN